MKFVEDLLLDIIGKCFSTSVKCETCLKQFSNKSNEGNKDLTNIDKINCNECSNSFTSVSNLNRHKNGFMGLHMNVLNVKVNLVIQETSTNIKTWFIKEVITILKLKKGKQLMTI